MRQMYFKLRKISYYFTLKNHLHKRNKEDREIKKVNADENIS